jgi:hypothetical protein
MIPPRLFCFPALLWRSVLAGRNQIDIRNSTKSANNSVYGALCSPEQVSPRYRPLILGQGETSGLHSREVKLALGWFFF